MEKSQNITSRFEERMASFVSEVNASATSLVDPLVVFGISLRAKTAPEQWQVVQENLNQTIKSLENQTNKNFIVLIAGHDRPSLKKRSVNVHWIRANWARPTEVSRYSGDKQRKRRLTLAALKKTELSGFYFFMLDADDLVHKDVCDFILTDDNRAGYVVDKGYVYDVPSKTLGALKGTTPFYEHCGSCAAVWLTKDELPESSSDKETLIHRIRDHVTLPETMRENGKCAQKIPFFAVFYYLNHGVNNLVLKGEKAQRKSSLAGRHKVLEQVKKDNIAKAFSISNFDL